MICVECGRDIFDKGGYVDGLVICGSCIAHYAETEQAPQPKVVDLDWERFVRRPQPTMERR
jgi:hypothetical protein